MEKKVYINYFDTISCAGNNAEELFSSIIEKKDTITLDSSYVKDKTVAIGKIKKDLSLNEILLKRLNKLLEHQNLKDFQNTLLIIGSSVGGMSETENVYFRDKEYRNIDYKKHPIDSIAYFLKQHFSFYDDISFSTACTSRGYTKRYL